MKAEEKLRIIHNWTAEFTIRTRMGGTVVVKTRLGKYSLPFTVVFDTIKQGIDVRFSMIRGRTLEMCERIVNEKRNEY